MKCTQRYRTTTLSRPVCLLAFSFWSQCTLEVGVMKKKALILVVDDNAEYRELLAWILDRYGFETIAAKSGREAVELTINCRPALILMDLNMPDMNGYEAAWAIQADRQTRGIPIVAVSADAGDFQ